MEVAIANAGPIGVITPAWVQPATRRALEDSLKEECDIFHFSGHGLFYNRQGEVILEQPNSRNSDPYEAGNLSHLLRDAKTKVAILSTCDTAERSPDNPWGGVAANLVVNALAAVVASQFRLRDTSALALTEKGVVTSLKEEHENSASRIFSSDRDCLAPHVHSRRAKCSVHSCRSEMAPAAPAP
jgi:hypothetical protein